LILNGILELPMNRIAENRGFFLFSRGAGPLTQTACSVGKALASCPSRPSGERSSAFPVSAEALPRISLPGGLVQLRN
jgi:hypothetical protein